MIGATANNKKKDRNSWRNLADELWFLRAIAPCIVYNAINISPYHLYQQIKVREKKKNHWGKRQPTLQLPHFEWGQFCGSVGEIVFQLSELFPQLRMQITERHRNKAMSGAFHAMAIMGLVNGLWIKFKSLQSNTDLPLCSDSNQNGCLEKKNLDIQKQIWLCIQKI